MSKGRLPDYKLRSVDELIPYARNSRVHSEDQVTQIASSIKEFGFTNPVLVDDDGGIIAGHGRVMAARKLGLSEVPCITLSHLTESQKRAYVIADNKLALNSGWDYEMLKLEIEELDDDGFDLSMTGFSISEIEGDILGLDMDAPEKDAPDDFGEVEESELEHKCPKCGYEFDE